jgi:hypothetical protein
LLDEKKVGRPQPEHHQRVAVEAIGKAPPSGRREILADRERGNVADAAAVEVARAGVMHGMAAPPMIVGCQRQHADDAAGPVVGLPLAEECAVPAIVLDHEEPHQEAGGGHGNGKAEPVAPAQARPCGDPEQDERYGGDEQLDRAARVAGRTIAVQNRQPVPGRDGAAAPCFAFQENVRLCSGEFAQRRVHLAVLVRFAEPIAAIATYGAVKARAFDRLSDRQADGV